MASNAPSNPKGTRDFSPAEAARREYIFQTTRDVFRLFGFQPIETPSMEYLSTLLGKYGDEGDKLIYRILNSGDFLQGIPDEAKKSSAALSQQICERGLRYDLTVPFARFVVQHFSELAFPFRRYQIQPVWRADRPQKGRYREFYQCDVDVIGSGSLVNETELVQIIQEVFRRLGLKVLTRLNNRKILAGIAEYVGAADRLTTMTTAIDKLEKIGQQKVNEELVAAGFSEESVRRLQSVLEVTGTNEEKITQLGTLLQASEQGMKGIEEMTELLGYLKPMVPEAAVDFDVALARGLDYYTGTIFEVKSLDIQIGSICGGGRYDNLTGVFGMPGVSGVGISFGADRIYDVLLQTNKFPESAGTASRILFVNFGTSEMMKCGEYLSQIRAAGISAEIYPDMVKMKKQLDYANRKNIPYVALVGEEELNQGFITLKNMTTGEQKNLTVKELIAEITPR